MKNAHARREVWGGACRLGLAASTAVFLLWSHGVAQAASLTFVDAPAGDFRISELSAVEINGSIYELTFHHGVSFNQFLADRTSTVGFGHDAFMAADQMNAAILAVGPDVTGAPNLTREILLPFSVSLGGSFVSSVRSVLQGADPLTYARDVPLLAITDSTLPFDSAWIEVAPAPVPESGTVATLVLGLVMLACFSRAPSISRRLRQALASRGSAN